jgi:hypothetical protein
MVTDLTEATFTVSGAVTEAMVDRWINTAISKYEAERQRLVGGYKSSRVNVSTVANSTPLVGTFPANQVVQLDSAVSSVLEVWLVYGSDRFKLEAMDAYDKVSPWANWPAQTGRPSVYRVVELDAGTLALNYWPPSDMAYTLELEVIQEHAQLAGPGDLWRFIPGTEDAVVCDVACKVLERDDEADTNQYRAYAMRKAEAFKLLRARLAKRSREVLSVRETRSEIYRSRRGWPR